MSRISVGIDIGSTCAKTIVMNEEKEILYKELSKTGWSSVDTANEILERIKNEKLYDDNTVVVATGYGRVSVPYANKMVTEITCHGAGASFLFQCNDMNIIDIGGQDTKIISVKDDMVSDFYMNDKCSAGTGRFLEVMANTMGLRPEELVTLARNGKDVKISSMCTVFAESEVVSLIGRGESRENIAHAVVDSIAEKVVSQYNRFANENEKVFLTGGLCEFDYLVECLENKIKNEIKTLPDARYAGAIGAALRGLTIKN